MVVWNFLISKLKTAFRFIFILFPRLNVCVQNYEWLSDQIYWQQSKFADQSQNWKLHFGEKCNDKLCFMTTHSNRGHGAAIKRRWICGLKVNFEHLSGPHFNISRSQKHDWTGLNRNETNKPRFSHEHNPST